MIWIYEVYEMITGGNDGLCFAHLCETNGPLQLVVACSDLQMIRDLTLFFRMWDIDCGLKSVPC